MKVAEQKIINVCLVGEGGQGVQTAGKLLAKIMRQSGYHVTYVPNYGVEQRGGSSIAFIRISSQHLDYPKFSSADHILLLAKRSGQRVENLIDSKTQLYYNSDFTTPEIKKMKNSTAYALSTMANELGLAKSISSIVLGLLIKKINLTNIEIAMPLVAEYFTNKYDQPIVDINKNALIIGYKL